MLNVERVELLSADGVDDSEADVTVIDVII